MSGGLTIGEAVAHGTERLAACGINSPRRDARLLAALAAGLDTAVVLGYPERPLDPVARERFDRLILRRMAHEPVSRLAGRREFWSLDFALSPDTLDPRPDSETLVAAALERIADRAAPLRLLDLGTGTGCLLLALLSELPGASGVGIDILPGAAALARRNAAAMGLESRSLFRGRPVGCRDRGRKRRGARQPALCGDGGDRRACARSGAVRAAHRARWWRRWAARFSRPRARPFASSPTRRICLYRGRRRAGRPGLGNIRRGGA